MSTEVNIRDFAAMVKAKRAGRGMRAVAQEIGGVSASTLSRIEQGRVPDLDTFIRICRWLEVPPNRFVPGQPVLGSGQKDESSPPEQLDTADIITAHLRADRTLAPETATALATMIRLAYDAAKSAELGEQKRG